MIDPGQLAAVAGALYVAHHVGDYWVQTDHQASHKGAAGREGRRACAGHCWTYVLTQFWALVVLTLVTGLDTSWYGLLVALAFSGLAHYGADRREYSLMFWLARKLGKGPFMKLGVPRRLDVTATDREAVETDYVPLDLPTLGTGAWALDQSWHLVTSVALPAVILLALS